MYVTLFYRKDVNYLYVCEAILLLDLWVNVLQTWTTHHLFIQKDNTTRDLAEECVCGSKAPEETGKTNGIGVIIFF